MWTPAWVRDAVFYQIFPDRFRRSDRIPNTLEFEAWDAPPTVHGFKGGNLYGVVDGLDYLSELGINAIYLNPVFASAANHRYHTYDYYKVDPLLGGTEALRALLDAAHARAVRVILDGVFNHASRGFWQFHHVLENGADSPYVDWFHFHPRQLSRQAHFAAYPDPLSQKRLDDGQSSFEAIGYGAWWNLPALPKFNTRTPAVREFLLDVAVHWIEFGIDGWRLDVPEEIDDPAFWREFRRRVKGVNPEAYIVGEIWHEAPGWLEGDQFDAVMNYPVMAACLGFFGGENLDLDLARSPCSLRHVRRLDAEGFASQIERVFSLYDPDVASVQLNLLDSHDTPRFLSCVRGDTDALRMAILFLMTVPGAPCIYYGDEIGLEGGSDPDSRRAFPCETDQWDGALLEDVKRYVRLRRENPVLRQGSFRVLLASDDIVVFLRRHAERTALVAFNAGNKTRSVEVSVEEADLNVMKWRDPLTAETVSVIDRHVRLSLVPRKGTVLLSQ